MRGRTRSPARGSLIGVSSAVEEAAVARRSAAEQARKTSGRRNERQSSARSRPCKTSSPASVGSFSASRTGARSRGRSQVVWRPAAPNWPSRTKASGSRRTCASWRSRSAHRSSRRATSARTMTYLGGERAVPHYNVMGVAKAALDSSVQYLAWDLGRKNIRVNAVSAGPVRTLAARSIAGFPTMEAIVVERSPLHRHIEADDVGAAAAYLLSDDARNVTGTTLYVDSGYHAIGM